MITSTETVLGYLRNPNIYRKRRNFMKLREMAAQEIERLLREREEAAKAKGGEND